VKKRKRVGGYEMKSLNDFVKLFKDKKKNFREHVDIQDETRD